MAEHHTGPAELGAEMDYAEHDRTYSGFVKVAKYGAMSIAILMICMVIGFFTKAGFLFSTLLFLVLNIIGFVFL